MKEIANIFIIVGVLFLAIGGVLYITAPSVPWGKLFGDIHIKIKDADVYIPIMSCIVVSIIVTVLLNVFLRSR